MASATNCKSVYFGQKEYGLPEIGIYVDGDKDWCSYISTNRKSRRSQIASTWNPSWAVFENAHGYEQLRSCKNVKEHFQTIVFKTEPCTEDEKDFEFGFYMNNFTNKRDEYSLVYVYSNQEQEMVLDGVATEPGNKREFSRYDDDNHAFCLTRTGTLAPAYQPNLYSRVSDEDVCSFTVMVTQAGVKSNQASDALNQFPAGEFNYEYDSGCTLSSGYYANAIRGKETNQEYYEIDGLNYTGALINIYNVVLLVNCM